MYANYVRAEFFNINQLSRQPNQENNQENAELIGVMLLACNAYISEHHCSSEVFISWTRELQQIQAE